MRMDGVDDMARARARISTRGREWRSWRPCQSLWVVKRYTRGTRHGAVCLGDAGLLPQAHGCGEQGGKKLYYTRCLYAPGWTARQSRG
jgi:hypothetical protein